jgi:hypothetical protein
MPDYDYAAKRRKAQGSRHKGKDSDIFLFPCALCLVPPGNSSRPINTQAFAS